MRFRNDRPLPWRQYIRLDQICFIRFTTKRRGRKAHMRKVPQTASLWCKRKCDVQCIFFDGYFSVPVMVVTILMSVGKCTYCGLSKIQILEYHHFIYNSLWKRDIHKVVCAYSTLIYFSTGDFHCQRISYLGRLTKVLATWHGYFTCTVTLLKRTPFGQSIRFFSGNSHLYICWLSVFLFRHFAASIYRIVC
jgi:hypothetical protein